jgi:predicted PurR-regulated permease PerM
VKLFGDGRTKASDLGAFTSRTFVVVGVLTACLILWRLRDVASVAFGSVVLAVGLDGLSRWIAGRANVARPLALALVLALAASLLGVAVWVSEATIAAQYQQLARMLPESLRALVALVRRDPLGREILAQAREGSLAGAAGSAPQLMAGVVRWIGAWVTYSLVMVFGGVFLAIDPDRYRHGVLRLAPPARRQHDTAFMARLASDIQRWLLGRLAVMVVVGALSSVGLWAVGVDAPFALGLTGALLSFVPFVGALMGAVPAMMVAFVQDPALALWVALLFWGVHFVEGTFITPYVEDKAVEVPPVLSIFSTTVFTLLLGPIGVFLAGPLTVVAMSSVKALYIEDVLGEHVERRQRRPFGLRLALGDHRPT